MCNNCATLAARNEELEAEIARLKAGLYGKHFEAPSELRLTRTERGLVQAMLAAGDRWCSRDFLLNVREEVLGHSNAEPKVIDVVLSNIRGKLRHFGMGLETEWATGWRLNAETRNRLLHWNTQTTQAA